jgi:hypothetical protein
MPTKAEKIAAAKWAEQKAKAALAAAEAEEVQAEQLPDAAPVAPLPYPTPRTYAEAITNANTVFQASLARAEAEYDGSPTKWPAYDAAIRSAYEARNTASREACRLPGGPASAPLY